MTRIAQRLLVSLMLAAGVMAAAAADFPSKPVHLVVPFPPGGTLDVVARLIGAKLRDTWRAADHRREPCGRKRRHRRRLRRQERARRPYAGAQCEPDRDHAAAAAHALRSPPRSGRGGSARGHLFHARGESENRRVHGRRTGRTRQEEPGPPELRQRRQRFRAAPVRRAVQERRQDRCDARTVQGRCVRRCRRCSPERSICYSAPRVPSSRLRKPARCARSW